MSRRALYLTLMSIVIAMVGLACGEDPPPSTAGVGTELPPPPPRPIREDPIYGRDGLPRESDVRVAGLVLPLGLEEVDELAEERRHVYRSVVPQAKLLRYFGPRLNTLEIDHEGARVTYREATPQGVRGGVVKLDVTIQASSDAVARVTIYERPPPPPPGTKIPEAEIRRHLESLNEHRE